MRATLSIKIEGDDGEVLYEGDKTSIFQLEGFYDRMVMTQLTELMRNVKSDIKLTRWFELLKTERGRV